MRLLWGGNAGTCPTATLWGPQWLHCPGLCGTGQKGDHGWARDKEMSHGDLAPALLHGNHSNLYWWEATEMTGYIHGGNARQ